MEREPVQFFEELMPDLLLQSREALGRFLSCSADDLAFVSNATSGVNTILRSIKFEQGDDTLYNKQERYFNSRKGFLKVVRGINFNLPNV